jgi:hypothetical protein
MIGKSSKNPNQARQGDIWFQKVKGKPKVASNSAPMTNNIIAYGEMTGHSHKIYDPPFSELESMVDQNGDIYVLSKSKDITISHDEHDPIMLEKNSWWCITRQREYDPIGVMRERRVAD